MTASQRRRSRKRSVTSDPPLSPPSHTFFVDRDLGPTFGRTLREHGLDVRLHNELFPESSAQDSIADHLWLRHAADKGWVALSRDRDILRTPLSVSEVMAAGGRLFIIMGDLPFRALALQFLGALEQVERFLERHPAPFIAKIKRETFKGGKGAFRVNVEMKVDLERWRQWRPA